MFQFLERGASSALSQWVVALVYIYHFPCQRWCLLWPLLLCCCSDGFVLVHLPQTGERLNSCKASGWARDAASIVSIVVAVSRRSSAQPHKHRYFSVRLKRVNKQIAQVYTIMVSRCLSAISQSATQKPINGFYFYFTSIRVSIEIIIIFHGFLYSSDENAHSLLSSTELVGPRHRERSVLSSNNADH